MSNRESEQAVRDYLELLQSGNSDLGRARSLAKRAKDPMVKLRAVSTVRRADEVEANFVSHAAAFAEAEGIAVEAWRDLGVPEPVLVRAELVRPTKKAAAKQARRSVSKAAKKGSRPVKKTAAKKSARTSKKATAKAARPAKKSAPKKAVRRAALDMDRVAAKLPNKPFKVRDLAERIDRPAETARSYLDRLVTAGRVEVVGTDPSGRGLPAKIYQRT